MKRFLMPVIWGIGAVFGVVPIIGSGRYEPALAIGLAFLLIEVIKLTRAYTARLKREA